MKSSQFYKTLYTVVTKYSNNKKHRLTNNGYAEGAFCGVSAQIGRAKFEIRPSYLQLCLFGKGRDRNNGRSVARIVCAMIRLVNAQSLCVFNANIHLLLLEVLNPLLRNGGLCPFQRLNLWDK